MTDGIRYICLSDVHLNHDRNPTSRIVGNLFHFFSQFEKGSAYGKLDLIVIAGDLFDSLMDCVQSDLFEALTFLSFLVKFCERNDVILRISEGTPGHDWKQSRLLDIVSSLENTKADVRWVQGLEIEHLKDLGLDILYVPDEHSSSAEETLRQVRELMMEKGLTQVDLSFMHGMFTYQMAGIPGKHDTHDEASYLSLTRHFINIGHVHTFSTYDRIIAQGSFDRLAHGEEEAKGAVYCEIFPDGDGVDHYVFVENKNALIFKTVSLSNGTMESALLKLDKVAGKLLEGSYLRIKAPKLHPVYQGFEEIKKRYPSLHLSKLNEEEEKEHQKALEDSTLLQYTSIEITPENVVSLIMEEVDGVEKIDAADKHLLRQLLENIQA